MSEQGSISILALASEFKGADFLDECKRLGCRVSLVTEAGSGEGPWPWDRLDEHWRIPDLRRQPDLIHAISYLARTRRFDRVVPLDDYDLEPAAQLREHFRLSGMGLSETQYFRDKLAMRVRAAAAGVRVPDFTALFNDAAVRAFTARVPGPWVLKPRTLAGSDGIQIIADADALWRALQRLGDGRSRHLLERYVAGDVYHVDTLSWAGAIEFASVSRYGTPPFQALQGRGLFSTRVLAASDPARPALTAAVGEVLGVLGRRSGASHTEFIRGARDGQWYFLETAARVGGGNIDRLVEAATGVHLWREVARIELAEASGQPYAPPTRRDGVAGMIACPTPPGAPPVDAARFAGPGVVLSTRTGAFVVVIVAGDEADEVEARLGQLAERFARELRA